jgi:hypothetical protein
MLYIPHGGNATVENNQGTTSAEYGTSVASHATVAHTKNATYTQLIASTAYASWGIMVYVGNTGTLASTNYRVLVDIAIGGAGSEQVIIPNLLAGNSAPSGSTSVGGSQYYFPICIPAGSRISATAQANTTAKTVHVAVYLFQHQIPGAWYGQRVTDYGTSTATSSGTSMSPGNNAYATDVSLTASTTNPIQYLQLGMDLLTNTTLTSSRGLARISTGTTPDILVDDLPFYQLTTLETIMFTPANFILSQMRFDIPAGTNLKISAMHSTTAASRGWAIYGVD